MSLIFRIILGGGIVVLGSFLIIKTESFLSVLGRNDWAEEKMASSGGSRTLYKLIGLAFIFIGLLMMTGLLGGFVIGTVGGLFVTSGTQLPQ